MTPWDGVRCDVYHIKVESTMVWKAEGNKECMITPISRKFIYT
jgi:hypothetical protein